MFCHFSFLSHHRRPCSAPTPLPTFRRFVPTSPAPTPTRLLDSLAECSGAQIITSTHPHIHTHVRACVCAPTRSIHAYVRGMARQHCRAQSPTAPHSIVPTPTARYMHTRMHVRTCAHARTLTHVHCRWHSGRSLDGVSCLCSRLSGSSRATISCRYIFIHTRARMCMHVSMCECVLLSLCFPSL